MKRLALATVVLLSAAPLAFTQSTTWAIDNAHSGVNFTISHMAISKVHGHFGVTSGTIVLDQTDPAKSSVQAAIDVSSVDTGNSGRDTDLKSDKFFNVAASPTATFVSTSVAKSGSGFTVNGNLTLHGVTKPVVLQVEGPAGPVTGPMDKKPHSGYSATTTIKRTDFGIAAGYPNAMVGDEVALTIDLETVQQ
jgi:polyisoprenoid-binding protein YceI